MTADYRRVEHITCRWGEHLAAGSAIRVSSAAGTDFSGTLGGWQRLPLLDVGAMPRGFSGLGNLPAGEAAISPIEGTTTGRVVADLTVSTTRAPLQTPIEILIEKGSVVEISGGSEADTLREFLDAVGDSARVVAEIALGTNERSLHIGVVLEDEKKLGSAHIGLGNALGFGGTNESPVHVDAIFDHVSVSVDGVALLKDGEVTEEGLRRESLGEFPGRPGRYVRSSLSTDIRDGCLHVEWRDVRGLPVWSQVGDVEASRAAASFLEHGSLASEENGADSRILELLERYGVISASDQEQ
jgi:leucyl aminopeptidase (aminopeptidase T)